MSASDVNAPIDTIEELLLRLHQDGLITLNEGMSDLMWGLKIFDWLNSHHISPCTPVPFWNEDAEAWEM